MVRIDWDSFCQSPLTRTKICVCSSVNLKSHLTIPFNQSYVRSHLATSFNQNQKNVKSGLIVMGDLPRWKWWSHYDGWPTQMKVVVSLWWVTYPDEGGGLIMMGDLPKEKKWSYCDGWPTQMEDERWSHCYGKVVSLLWVTYLGKWWSYYDGWPTQKKILVSLWWVTYPNKRCWSHYDGWPTQRKMKSGLIVMGDLPKW